VNFKLRSRERHLPFNMITIICPRHHRHDTACSLKIGIVPPGIIGGMGEAAVPIMLAKSTAVAAPMVQDVRFI
jgi:hypothetical protein